MSVIISVLNQKGGAGKTTLATNIAAALSALVNTWIADYITEQNKRASSSANNSTEL